MGFTLISHVSHIQGISKKLALIGGCKYILLLGIPQIFLRYDAVETADAMYQENGAVTDVTRM